MTKGFVTLATGHERYFQMAYHLLVSYRYAVANESQYPFAIIADKEDDYTHLFDSCTIISKPHFYHKS